MLLTDQKNLMSKDLEHKFTALIQQHAGIIHKVVGLYIDLKEDRQDALQEVMLQAWRSYKNYRGDAAFSTWLYKVALNTVLTFKRNEKKLKLVDFDQAKQSDLREHKKEDHEILYSLIKQLNEIDRTLMTLHLEGYENTTIARMLGITQNHVNVKIHRLKNQIINDLKKLTHGHI